MPIRPGEGGFRPGWPGGPDRPGGSWRPGGSGGGRPIIGGGNTTNIINNNIQNIQNNINYRPTVNQWNQWATNRPYWNQWGYGGRPYVRPWHDQWCNHGIRPWHRPWYHGCWHGNSGWGWYSPFIWTGVGWGLNSIWNSGYVVYSNPYYVFDQAATPVYNYSQPININIDPGFATADPNTQTETTQQPPPEPSNEERQAMESFDKARTSFQRGGYAGALNFVDAAIRLNGGDAVLHEFRALCLFALGKYDAAAAVLNSLLAVAPGWDWTTMSGLYGDPKAYEEQLRKLEKYCNDNPKSAAPHFVLAYHYMVAGHADAAVAELKLVSSLQPNDAVASQMLASLDQKSTPDTAPPPKPPAPTAAQAETEKPVEPTTDLVGRWLAKRADGAEVSLQLTEVGGFEWKIPAADAGKSIQLTGTFSIDNGFLVLDSKTQGAMVGQVTSDGPDKFTFVMVGGPPGDKGLTFERAK